MQKACISVGNAIWTMTYTDHNDGTITVLNFDKEDNDGYQFGASLPVLQNIQETGGSDRIADKATIAGTTYDIRNKQNVYTYKQPL